MLQKRNGHNGNRKNRIFRTATTLEGLPALGKNLDNSWTQKRAYTRRRKFERQLAKPSRNLGRKLEEKSNLRKLLQTCVENYFEAFKAFLPSASFSSPFKAFR